MAFKEPVLQEPAVTLIDIEQFECSDVRDKLYGVLALVDWGRCPIPSPDYSKDNFQVAVDSLSAMSVCENRTFMGSDLCCARYVLKVFAVTLTTASLRNAIQMRPRKTQEPMLPNSDRLDVVARRPNFWASTQKSMSMLPRSYRLDLVANSAGPWLGVH
jgi:hypothetical protein